VALPFLQPQLNPTNLPAHRFRKVFYKLDCAGVFIWPGSALDEILELLNEFLCLFNVLVDVLVRRRQHDECLDDRVTDEVGGSDYRGFSNRRMFLKSGFDFKGTNSVSGGVYYLPLFSKRSVELRVHVHHRLVQRTKSIHLYQCIHGLPSNTTAALVYPFSQV